MLGLSLPAQSNVSVPVTAEIYYVLEAAQMRGLLLPLPAVKPYSKKQILEAIDAIFNADTNGKLSGLERDILHRASQTYGRDAPGLNWQKGTYNFATSRLPRNTPFTGDIGIGAELSFSGGVFGEKGKDGVAGTDNRFTVYTNGDLGEHFSYGFNFMGHLTLAERIEYNDYWNYYEGADRDPDNDYELNAKKGYINQQVPTYSQPLAYFPYTYERYWDGWVVYPASISATGFEPWPQEFGIAPMLLGEISGGFFDDTLTWRFGRLRHDWASMSGGRSLVFNGAAQPFAAVEARFNPVYWFSFSALTGSLEYHDREDIKISSWTQQNNFSIEMLELNYKDRFHFDVGSTAVWAKRFDIGYIFPIKNNFLYQDALGDFDNMAFFFDMSYQYPNYGKAWISFFADEMDPGTIFKNPKQFFEYDRMMYVAQAGVKAVIPRLPFSSITFSYTKVEPYAYTHNRVFVPWYNNTYNGNPMPMEQAYTNAGESLGYYLPPNSDEFLLRFDTMPALNTLSFFQYQMIRHGAEHGPHAVDGSSFLSELDPSGRTDKDELRKFFLRDGAYQWQHIFMIGAEHTLTKFRVPLRFFAKTGVVYSFYTDIKGDPNSGEAFNYRVINTRTYPRTTEFILTLGMRIYM